ncbi:MAG: flippase-like domain-containing protein [Syntrophaceae bacterium]|nr:flippase-like domain-containing protein [Syntrophaceae bacterium]
MNYRKILRYTIASTVIIAAAYFFYREFINNADALRKYDFAISPLYIFISTIFGTSGFLVGPVVWQLCVNNYIQRKLTLQESVALYNTSALLKYVPGKIWTYAAQITMLSNRGISNAAVVYINLMCFICLFFVSMANALFYYLFWLKVTHWVISALIFILLIALDFVFIKWNTAIINPLIIPLGRLFKVEIEPIEMKKRIFVYVQLLYFVAYGYLGVALYFLAIGIGMNMPFLNIFAIMATISLSALMGYIAFFSPGGLGVREGTMFVMMRQFSTVEVALILPLAARLLCIIADIFLGFVGIYIGMRYGYFSKLVRSKQPEAIAKETETDTNS